MDTMHNQPQPAVWDELDRLLNTYYEHTPDDEVYSDILDDVRAWVHARQIITD
jgi:hypothetical protein